jgi:hypothetical protein
MHHISIPPQDYAWVNLSIFGKPGFNQIQSGLELGGDTPLYILHTPAIMTY